jgi:hypothetical protein
VQSREHDIGIEFEQRSGAGGIEFYELAAVASRGKGGMDLSCGRA